MANPRYNFEPLKEDTEWNFSNGEVLYLPKGANILSYQVCREASCILIYSKKKDKKNETGLSEQSLDISVLGELEKRLKELTIL